MRPDPKGSGYLFLATAERWLVENEQLAAVGWQLGVERAESARHVLAGPDVAGLPYLACEIGFDGGEAALHGHGRVAEVENGESFVAIRQVRAPDD